MTTRNPFSGGEEPQGSPAPPEGDGHDTDRGARAQAAGGGSADEDAFRGGRWRPAVDPAADEECAKLPLTDLGNAERWFRRHGRDFRFCPEIGWFAWDGRRWDLLSEEKDALPARVMQSVFATVRAIRNEAALVSASGYEPPLGMTDKQLDRLETWTEAHKTSSFELYMAGMKRAAPDVPEAEHAEWLGARERMDIVLGNKLWSQSIAAWAKTSEGAGKLQAVARLAKSFEGVVIETDALDRDRMAINVLNGTLRIVPNRVKRSDEEVAAGKSAWKTSGWKIKRFPHAREDLITKLAPVKYAPSATCPAYDGFIERVQPEEAMRRFIHQWGGLSLTGDISEHKLAFFHGGGRNGKGTWVEAVGAIVGDYAGSIGIESLAGGGGKRRGDQATPDLARLPGVRFLRVSEPEEGMRFNDGLIKQLTGGDPVDARHLNKGFFTFLPSFKLTISGNNKPKIKDLSHGMWARMQLVPWDVTIPEAEIDRGLPDTLKGEASGILNRLIEGLLEWRAEGLIVPDKVKAATRAYRDASDDVGRFLAAICEVGDDTAAVRVGARELHRLYRAWAEHAGASPIGERSFKEAMEKKGFEQKQSDGMKWLGVQPRPGVSLEDVERGVWPRDYGEDVAAGAGVASGAGASGASGAGSASGAVPGFDD